MNITRRAALMGSIVLPLGVAACAGKTAAQVGQTVVSDVQLIGNALSASLPALAVVSGLSASAVSSIQAAIGQIGTIGQQIVAGMTVAQGQPLVQQIETDFGTVLGIVSGLPLPGGISQVIAAVQILLPVVEAAVGMAVAAGAPAGAMTPAKARLILATAAR